MGLKEVLSRLKLVEVSERGVADPPAAAPPPAGRAPAASRTSPPDLDELLRTLPPPKPIDESVLARVSRAGAKPAAGSGAPSGSSASPGSDLELPDFPAVYRAAGIAEPPHGFTAFKVLEMLQSPGIAELPPAAKASALAGFLKMNPGGPVAIGEIIQDAVRRDQALDRFEQFLYSKLAERQAAAERSNAALQAEIDTLTQRHRASMAANTHGVSELAARLAEWSAGKRAEEHKLQSAVAPFVDGNPITTEPAAATSRGS